MSGKRKQKQSKTATVGLISASTELQSAIRRAKSIAEIISMALTEGFAHSELPANAMAGAMETLQCELTRIERLAAFQGKNISQEILETIS